MKDDWWKELGGDMVSYGVQKLQNEYRNGPQYAIGVAGVMPFEFIPMEIGGFEIIRNFSEHEDAETEQYMFREEHVYWERAKRNGEATVKIARGMLETPGMRWLNMRPWGLMALGWEGFEDYFPGILERMQTVLTEVCGVMQFVDERGTFRFPNQEQVKASSELGINVPH